MLTLLSSLLLVPAAAVASHHLKHNNRNALVPRDGSSLFTNYFAAENEGACGAWHQDTEYVVAYPMSKWNNGAECNKQVCISSNGMTVTATIVDECEGCADSQLDFSQGLFGHFVGGVQNDNNVGQIYGSYTFGACGSSDPAPTTTTHTTTSTTTKKTTTSTTPTPTTTTHTTTSTTTTRSSTTPSPSPSSAAASTSHSSSAAPATTSASPSAPAAPTDGPQNLEAFAQVFMGLAGLVIAGPGA
ncbi:hypothetical protein K438DRAFT_1960498 [Mycena galopus ATCC 62051]|nr:hypothetical protein K438DRAFT_1960498 [Mycena galopus ATCC 62051]